MRWARYEANGNTSYGLVEGDMIQPVLGCPFEGWERQGAPLRLADVKLLVPVIPRTFYAQGRNYEVHLNELKEYAEKYPRPTQPEPGQRSNGALVADGEAIVLPRDAGPDTHPEGELVVVIGKKAKNLSEADALSCVLGYTIGNDVGQRTWLKTDTTLWRSKNSDTFKPMGPWIETDVTLPGMRTKVSLNGELVLDHETNAMIFSVQKVIAGMTRYITLQPGDVIWMGAEGNVGSIEHGDEVAIEITGIGTLRNPVLREGQ